MSYSITEKNNPKLQEFYSRAITELNDFFEISWQENRPDVILVPDRAEIDRLRGEKTEPWLVGWTLNGKGNVYLLDSENFEKESVHTYSDDKYYRLMKHELAHCYYSKVSNGTLSPIWLREGVSIFLSGQNVEKQKPTRFQNFLDFYDHGGKDVYEEAGFVVEYLVKMFGKNKLVLLLKESKDASTSEDFSKLFTRIYRFKLDYDSFYGKL